MAFSKPWINDSASSPPSVSEAVPAWRDEVELGSRREAADLELDRDTALERDRRGA